MSDQQASPVRQGEWLVDPQTGEVVGHAEAKPEFHVVNDDTADWVCSLLSEADADMLALQAQADAIAKRMNQRIQRVQRRRDWVLMRFGQELERYVAERLAKGKTRTLTLPHASLSLRRTGGSITVIDIDAALAWARDMAPDAIRESTKYSIDKKVLRGREDLLPRTVFTVSAPADAFGIDTGIKPSAAAREE